MARRKEYVVDLRPLGGRVVRIESLDTIPLLVYDQRQGRSLGRYTLSDLQKKFL